MSELKLLGNEEIKKDLRIVDWNPNVFAATLMLYFSRNPKEHQHAVRLTHFNLQSLINTMKAPISDKALLQLELQNQRSKSGWQWIALDSTDRKALKEFIRQYPVLLTNDWSSLLSEKQTD